MGATGLAGEPTPSCRLDWLSVSFYAASRDLQHEQLAYCFGIQQRICPGIHFTTGGGKKFFENALYCSQSGIQIRWSEPDTPTTNAGSLSVDFTGTTLRYLNAEDRQGLYLDLEELEGYRHATRLDTQRTLIEPMATAEDIHLMVRRRETWIARKTSYSQLGPVDLKGNAVNGASVVWGGRTSLARCMTYNKALEAGWEGCEAVRHEIRFRAEPARDLFAALVGAIHAAPDSKPEAVEAHFVQSALAKHMTYRDTKRFSRLVEKAEWPKDWATQTPEAPFWKEVVTGTPMELRTRWNPESDLEETMQQMFKQYGRKVAMYVFALCHRDGLELREAYEVFLSHCTSRWRDDDLEELHRLVPQMESAELERAFREWRSTGAHNLEL